MDISGGMKLLEYVEKSIWKSINFDLFAYLLSVSLHEENSMNPKGSILEKNPLTWASRSIIRYSRAKKMGHGCPSCRDATLPRGLAFTIF